LLHEKQLYASDLTDPQWKILKPLLYPSYKGPGRPLELDLRQVVNAIFYVMQTGLSHLCTKLPIRYAFS
jgi:putative transposase